MEPSLQEKYAPKNACFGCGPSNPKGLRLRSFVEGDLLVADWQPSKEHEAFPGVLNGGIIGALLDCHSNWAAAWFLMKDQGLSSPPCTVTSEFHVKLKRPTPSSGKIRVVARCKEMKKDRCVIEAELLHENMVCDTCVGTFVSVPPEHPAYHRW